MSFWSGPARDDGERRDYEPRGDNALLYYRLRTLRPVQRAKQPDGLHEVAKRSAPDPLRRIDERWQLR